MDLFISIQIANFIIPVIFAVAVYLAYKDIYKAFIGMLLLMPLMHKELFSLGVWDLLPIRVFILGIGLVLALRFVNFLRNNKFEDLLSYAKRDPFLIIFSVLWIFRFISIYNSADSQRSFFMLAFFSLTIIIYFAYKHIILNNEDRFYDILKAYLFVGFLTQIFAIVQYYLRLCCRETVGGVWVIPGFTPRLGSSFWDVNHYGAFLITLIPLIFNFMVVAKPLKYRIMYGLYFILSVWLLFMTQSRSAWIGLFVGTAITVLIYFWSMLKKAILYGSVALAVVLIAGISAIQILNIDVQDKISSYMHHRLDSTDTHFMLLTASAEIFSNNFFFGSGYGNFDSAFRETDTATDYFDREPKLRDALVPSHSIWGEVLGEGGAVGITLYTLFMVLILGTLIYSIKKIKTTQKGKYLGIGLLGGFISLLTAGLFYSYNMEFYWIFIFMAIGYVFVSNEFDINLEKIILWWKNLRLSPYLLILPAAIFFIYLNLGQTSLIDYDEAIYGKISKNIVLTNDWITLTWKDFDTPWFEKPPLYMWSTALLFKLFGFGEFAVRFTSAFFGVMGIVFVYLFGKRLYNKTTGLISALIMLSVIQYMYYARNGMLDVTVTFFILSTIYFFYQAYTKEKSNLVFYLLAGLTLGLGVMTKSIIGLLPLVIIVGYLILAKLFLRRLLPESSNTLSIKGLFAMAGTFVLVAAPWHVYAYYLHGYEFIDEYLIEHVFERGLSGLGHKAPLLWYLEVIKVSFRIWVLALIPGLLALPIFDKKHRDSFLLLFISIAVIFSFFSASEDKLQWYIIPIYPFLALIAGRFIERFFIIANDLIKKDYSLSPIALRTILILGTLLVSVFYFIWNKDKVYYPDFNKDKVALVKIFNEKFPVDEYPDRRLHYYNMSEPILLFYSDHKIKSVTKNDIVRKIEEADVNENFSFLASAGTFYYTRDLADEVNFPLSLDNQGTAGDWILFRSRSRVEISQLELDALRSEYSILVRRRDRLDPKPTDLPFTAVDAARVLEIEARIPVVINQLIDYGYPPAILK